MATLVVRSLKANYCLPYVTVHSRQLFVSYGSVLVIKNRYIDQYRFATNLIQNYWSFEAAIRMPCRSMLRTSSANLLCPQLEEEI